MEPMNCCGREMTLSEWCSRLPEIHAVNKELKVLKHCRKNPFKWALWDIKRKYLGCIKWKPPYKD